MWVTQWVRCVLILAIVGCDRPEHPPARAESAPGPAYLAVPAGAALVEPNEIAALASADTEATLPRGTHTLVYGASHFRALWDASHVPGTRPDIDFAHFNVLVLRVRDGDDGGPAVYAGEGRTIVLLEEGRHPAAPELGTRLTLYRIPIDGGPVTHIGFRPRGE